MSSIQIPADRLAPIARRTASNAKAVAAVTLFVWVLFLIAGVALVMGKGAGSTSEHTQDGGGAAFGLAIWLIVIGAIAQAFLKRGKRATDVARITSLPQSSYTFAIEGKKIVTTDGAGVLQDQLTFKVSGSSRAELLAVPRAQAMPPR